MRPLAEFNKGSHILSAGVGISKQQQKLRSTGTSVLRHLVSLGIIIIVYSIQAFIQTLLTSSHLLFGMTTVVLPSFKEAVFTTKLANDIVND